MDGKEKMELKTFSSPFPQIRSKACIGAIYSTRGIVIQAIAAREWSFFVGSIPEQADLTSSVTKESAD